MSFYPATADVSTVPFDGTANCEKSRELHPRQLAESGHADNALELYAAVLAQDPQNDEAREGLRRLFSVARARIQSDLTAGKLDEATRLLAAFRDVGLNNDATAKLDADIAAARPKWLIAQARPLDCRAPGSRRSTPHTMRSTSASCTTRTA